MKAIDFLIFITHKFLSLLKKVNDDDIKGRCINAVSIIIFFLIFLVFSIAIMFLKAKGIYEINKMIFLILALIIFVSVYYKIKSIYSIDYEEKIMEIEKKYTYKKNQIIMLFLFIWFVPIFTYWLVLLVLPNYLTK